MILTAISTQSFSLCDSSEIFSTISFCFLYPFLTSCQLMQFFFYAESGTYSRSNQVCKRLVKAQRLSPIADTVVAALLHSKNQYGACMIERLHCRVSQCCGGSYVRKAVPSIRPCVHFADGGRYRIAHLGKYAS